MAQPRSWLPLVPVLGIFAILGLAMAFEFITLPPMSFGYVQSRILAIEREVHTIAAIYLLIGAICYARTRKLRFLLVSVIWAALAIIITLLTWSRFPIGRWSNILLSIGQILVNPSIFAPFLLLLSAHCQDHLERLRILAMILIVVAAASQVLTFFLAQFLLRGDTAFDAAIFVETLSTGTLAGTTIMMAWCLAFRQAQIHRPPVDSDKTLAFTCPRCHSPQEITLPAGQCAACRLQFAIALKEGVCAKCRYPLRGLTGDRCPECGTHFVSPAPVGASQPSFTDRPG